MEFVGANNSEGEWSSLSGMHTSEEADFMAQLLGNCSFPSHGTDGLGTIRSGLGLNLNSDSLLFPISSHENYSPSDSRWSFDVKNSSMSMGFHAKTSSSYLTEGQDCLNQDTSNINILSENSRKRSRNSADVPKSVKTKKIQKGASPSCNDQDCNGQSSSGCSEDESHGSQDTTSLSSRRVPALNSNGTSRASRGSATDPQSLYARKRRERINERLRILQNLVPNGTKVDISTMLEEAVQYVKFLQLQIKLLSSDDMWMYAPIAYNGMNIGLDFKVPASRQS